METEHGGAPRSINNPTAIIIAGIIIALAIIWSNGKFSAPTDSGAQPPATAAVVDSSKVIVNGEPYIGNANAPLTIAYWFDYQCPFCKQDEQTSLPLLIQNYVDTGKARIVFKDFAFLGDDSLTLGKYARAVWTVAPTKFYLWHKTMFDNQGTENTGWATTAKITQLTSSVLGPADAAKVGAFVASNGATYLQQMDADKAEGSALGITGTPAIIVGKQLVSGAVPYAQLKAAVEAAMNGK